MDGLKSKENTAIDDTIIISNRSKLHDTIYTSSQLQISNILISIFSTLSSTLNNQLKSFEEFRMLEPEKVEQHRRPNSASRPGLFGSPGAAGGLMLHRRTGDSAEKIKFAY